MSKVIYLRDKETGKVTAVENVVVVQEGAVERLNMRNTCGFGPKGPIPALPSSVEESAKWAQDAERIADVLNGDHAETALGKTGYKNLSSIHDRLLTGVRGFAVMSENGWTVDDFRDADETPAPDADPENDGDDA